jgi:hypothetical protein
MVGVNKGKGTSHIRRRRLELEDILLLVSTGGVQGSESYHKGPSQGLYLYGYLATALR